MTRYPVLFAASELLAACSGHAFAAHPLAETPAADEAVSDSLGLTFSDGLEAKFTTVVMTRLNGSAMAGGQNCLAPYRPAEFVVTIADRLAPGRDTVDRHAVATDGYKTSSAYGFTVTP